MRTIPITAAFALLLLMSSATARSEEQIGFERDVLPILRVNCISCHKPGKAKGGLDLTTLPSLMKGGHAGPSIKAGDPLHSRLIETIEGETPEMPKDGEALTASEIELLTRWVAQGALVGPPVEMSTKHPRQPLIYQSLPSVNAMAFSPDGALLAVPGRHEILLHKADGTGIAARLPGDSPRLEAVAFSKDGSLLVASGGAVSEFGEIQIWDVVARRLVRSIKASNDSFYGLSISPDNRRVAVGCADKLVRVFDIADGNEVMRCDNHLDWVFGTAFSNDGRRLVTVSRDKAAKLIDIATGHLIDDVNQPRDPLLCLARHPLEELVATGGTEGKIRLFKMEPRGGRLAEGDNKENSFVREFEHMGAPILTMAFKADGSLIACGASSGEVRVFRVDNGQRLAQFKVPHGAVFAMAFSADGKQLATGGADGRIRFHETEKWSVSREFESVPTTSGSSLP
ncbi:MAG: hypothetical protein C0478_01650 [Planctomyces sp.]|nr:hypothetical protein [Planctomyces sp.]